MSDTIARLRDAVRASGTPLAASLGPDADPGDPQDSELALLAAGGPRVAEHREDVEVAVAAVVEGYRLHYGGGARALRIDDADLALLAGDRMYALGLARLAAIGDLVAIAELADIISLSAQAHASDNVDLADAAWQAGALAIARGPDPHDAEAKARACAGEHDPGRALRDAARANVDA